MTALATLIASFASTPSSALSNSRSELEALSEHLWLSHSIRIAIGSLSKERLAFCQVDGADALQGTGGSKARLHKLLAKAWRQGKAADVERWSKLHFGGGAWKLRLLSSLAAGSRQLFASNAGRNIFYHGESEST